VIFIDTTILINFINGKTDAKTKKFRELNDQDTPYCIPAICCQELLQGARNQSEFDALKRYVMSQEIAVPSDPVETHLEAAHIFYQCRKKGHTIRKTIDCLIAQIVIENEGILLHNDKDFDVIADVFKLKDWVKFNS
jgi:predicted nucleic acid-binding protein